MFLQYVDCWQTPKKKKLILEANQSNTSPLTAADLASLWQVRKQYVKNSDLLHLYVSPDYFIYRLDSRAIILLRIPAQVTGPLQGYYDCTSFE